MMVPHKLLSLVFVMDASHVLLGLKKRGFGKNKYNGFGGKCEAGETVRACAARELQEECGLVVDEERLIRRGVLTFNMLSDGMSLASGDIASRLEVHVYSCARSETTGDVSASEEMEPKWWPLEAVPLKQMWADDEFWLPHVLAGRDVLADFVRRERPSSRRLHRHCPTRLRHLTHERALATRVSADAGL